MPFNPVGSAPETASFAQGLTEEITAGISQFRHLVAVSSSAAARYEGRADIRAIGKELGARFLIEGRVRKAGSTIKVSVRLIDTATGAHLWADTMSHNLDGSDLFQAQDELTDRIVATTADPFGVLTRSLGEPAKEKPVEELTADDCILRWFSYWGQVREEEHLELRSAFERALEREPQHADAWACLCFLCNDEIRQNFNRLPDAPGRALRAAQRAVEIDRTSPLAYRALAEAHFFRGEVGPFRKAADRVIEHLKRTGII